VSPAAPASPPVFDGFSPEAMAFLADLAIHNDRDWFKARQDVYEREVKRPMQALVRSVAARLEAEALGLTGSPKTAIFRIHRDTRFSPDKTPYKPWTACYFSATGSKKEDGGLYVHVQPGACRLSCGVYHPEPPALAALRRGIAGRPDAFRALVDRMTAAGLPPETDSALKTLPKGFRDHADGPVADWLKAKSLYVSRPVSEIAFLTPEAVDEIVAFARDAAPLLDFVRTALGDPAWRADARHPPGGRGGV
jgi:uncharacterized protein (TIGR02453 family)